MFVEATTDPRGWQGVLMKSGFYPTREAALKALLAELET